MNHIHKKCILTLLWILSDIYTNYATHNRAGEITIKQIDTYTVEAHVNTYTKESSSAADRDSITISWGDGTITKILRSNGTGVSLGNNIKKNIYIGTHTYPGRASYIIGFYDPNRIENILNIDYPNSVNISFYIETKFTFLNSTFQGPNNTVELLQHPIDFACVNTKFIHNPAAYDIDGDSLSFELITPLLDQNIAVPNYQFPTAINPGPNNVISFDRNTGTIVWDSPQKEGEYNITFVVHEYRSGKLLASTIRDMQILVLADCNKNLPPVISAVTDTCVIAGQSLKIPIKIYDPNIVPKGNKFKIEFTGSPFLLSPAATHPFGNIYYSSEQNGIITWNTNCDLIAPTEYILNIKATDDYLDNFGLSSIHVIRIKIVGPPPINENITKTDSGNLIKWKNPYLCQPTNLFKGFSIWKRINNTSFNPDSCTTNIPSAIYKKINYLTNQKILNEYYYLDPEIVESNCYRIQAEFAKTSSAGYPYNFVGSIPSKEICIDDKNDKAIITNVDVLTSSATTGIIMIKWRKPDMINYDTLLYPGPYQILVKRKNKSNNYDIIYSKSYPHYNIAWDSTTLYQNINTIDDQYTFAIDIISNNNIKKSSREASSIFLNITPVSSKYDLKWNEKTPWYNDQYRIYKLSDNNPYKVLNTTRNNFYTDNQLIKETKYCYYIESKGSYNSNIIKDTLINKSQEVCMTLIDTIAPCCLTLDAPDYCGLDVDQDSFQSITFHYSINLNLCTEDDINRILLYGINSSQDTNLISSFDYSNAHSFSFIFNTKLYNSFFIRPEDAFGNVCYKSNSVNPIYCPEFKLPNTFSPNGDFQNDIFKSIISKSINKVDFTVFNRWGELLFNTNDPHILWDGTDRNGKLVEAGTYYYTCVAFPVNNHQNKTIQLSGFIEVLTAKK